ncbi:hypothetical protein [Amycolatopsis sp. NPDC049868]|uniref:hypothetical protein n=1 Tax=Amycolatopsis sp. NPDC049868 TaxID=3363934 RepID=UPI003789BD26
MSGAAVVRRHDLTSWKTGTRILFAGGLALTGWLLGAVLSTPASADEQLPVTPETSVVQPSDEAGPGKTTTPNESTSDSSTTETTKPAKPTETSNEPAPVSSEEPEATVEEKAVSSASSVEKTSSPEPETKTAKASNGLLGGLIGGVLNTVTTTVGGVVETVGGVVGVVDGIGDQVVAPIVTPNPCCGAGAPVILPGTGDLLDPVFGGGSGESASGSVTIAVPAKAVTQDAPVTPAPRPLVPAENPVPVVASQNHRVTLPVRVEYGAQPAPAAPAESDTHASRDGGGSGGGGGLPSAPVAPVAPTTTVQPGHDHTGGGRGPLAVLDSGIPATQLKLIGTGCDHEGERTGREAALPATSPD